VPVAFFFLHRYLGLRAAMLALGLFLPVTMVASEFDLLNYHDLLPLPLAVYYASVALLAESGAAVFGAIGAVALVAALSGDLGCIVLVPFHFLLVALISRRRAVAVATACCAFAIAYCWDSMDAAREMLRAAPTFPFAAALAISVGIGALVLRSGAFAMMPSMSTADRVRTIMTASLMYATGAVWLASPLTEGLPQPRYFAPAVFPFLFLVGDATRGLSGRRVIVLAGLESLSLLLLSLAPHAIASLHAPFIVILTVAVLATAISRWWHRPATASAWPLWPGVALCLCTIGLALGHVAVGFARGPAQAFTLAEAEPLVSELYDAKYTYAEIMSALQGPAADGLIFFVADHDPNLFGEPPAPLAREGFSLLALKVPNPVISRTRGIVGVVPIDHSRSAIVIRGGQPYLDWVQMRRCAWTSEGVWPVSYGCRMPRTDQPISHRRPFVEFGDPLPNPDRLPPRGARTWDIHFEVPVKTVGRGAAHIVRTANEWPAQWRITRVSGVEFSGTVPGPEIRLADSQEAAGVVEFEYTAAAPGPAPWLWIPHVVEVAEENEQLVAVLRGAG
jgi:hypothetical protein